MLTQETKRKIDSARNILVGKVPDPKAQVDQITTALIYKFMDDMDKEAIELGGKARFFTKGFEKYAWTKLLDQKLGGHERLELYGEAVAKMSQNPHIPQLFRDIFKDAFLPYRSPETLTLFLKEINGFTYDHSEDLGNAFEYLLSILGSQGDAGQFRTPRHIIDFIVDVVEPKKGDTILDPACGTAGFLISAYKHILKKQKDKPLTPDEKEKLMNSLVGYDISPDMVKLSKVNMYLHGFAEPKIFEYDTLSSEEKWDEMYDVIMANPPFMSPTGGIKPHKRFSVQANRAEVLFVDYIKEHLRPNGRAGIIVPEGIIFQSAGAYKQLRKMLVEDGLFAVVSLPAGVFNPYSNVKTSILFFDNSLAKKTDKILFVRVLNDGFDLGSQRRPRPDLPNDLVCEGGALDVLVGQRLAIETGKKNKWLLKNSIFAYEITKEQIAKTGDYSLSSEIYRLDNLGDQGSKKYPLVEMKDICAVDWGNTNLTKSSYIENGKYLAVSAAGCDGRINEFEHEVGVIVLSAIGANCGRIFYPTENFTAIKNTITFTPNREKILPKYLFYIMRKNELPRRGGAQPFMSKGDVEKYKIPLPPIEIQKEIVGQIDTKQEAIEHAKAIIQNLERERRHFGQVLKKLDCKLVNMGEIFEKVNEQINPKNETGKTVYVGLENIESNSGNLVGEVNAEMKSIKSAKIVFKKGDILYGKLRPNLNKVWFADRGGVCSTDILVLRSKSEDINSELYSLIMRNDEFNVEVLKGLKGSQLPRISFDYFASLKIPLLSLEIQGKLLVEMKKEEEIIVANNSLIEIMEKKISAVLSEI